MTHHSDTFIQESVSTRCCSSPVWNPSALWHESLHPSVRRRQSSVAASRGAVWRRGRGVVPEAGWGAAGEMDAGGEGEESLCYRDNQVPLVLLSENHTSSWSSSNVVKVFTLHSSLRSTCFRCIINICCSIQYSAVSRSELTLQKCFCSLIVKAQ